MEDEIEVYAVLRYVDYTNEPRILSICRYPTTAERLAKNAGTNNEDAIIKEYLIKKNEEGIYIGPCMINDGTLDDYKLYERQQVIEKLKSLGITDEEINILSRT